MFETNELVYETMLRLYSQDTSGRLLRFFITKLIAVSKLKAYGIDDENKLYVVTKDEYEVLKGIKNMDIKKNITIELSENDVKEIIKDYLKKEGYSVSLGDVSLSVGTRLEGFGRAEHPVEYFKGAFVKCKEK